MTANRPYRGAAAFYDRYRPQYSAELVRFILGLTTERRDYLDIGCGTGALLFEMAPHFTQATGVDVDPDMLAVAASKCERDRCDHVDLIQRSAESYLEARSKALDLITAARSIHWMDQSFVLARAHELLNPGGALGLVGDRVSLWERQTDPFRAVRNVLEQLETERATRFQPAGGPDRSFAITLDHLRRSPFAKYEKWKCKRDWVWTPEQVVNYFYSASGLLTWLGADRDLFDREARRALDRLSPDAFRGVIEFGVTYSIR